VRYYATPNQPHIRDAMAADLIRAITSPRSSDTIPPGTRWAADNGCYGNGYPGNFKYLSWLRARDPRTCDFAVAPDVVGDAGATLARATPLLPRIRTLGYPVAYVAQDGQQAHMPDWDTFDVLFLGGTTDWKLGIAARSLTAYAITAGKPVHMGRVNSYRRIAYAASIGCTSVDGTYLTWRPHQGLDEILDWLHRLEEDT
jgi:hypothetical protein